MRLSTALQVHCPRGLARTIVAPALPRLLQQYRDLRVRIHEYDRSTDISTAAGCLALTVDDNDRSALIAHPLSHVRTVTCASKEFIAINGAPTHPADLDPEHCIQVCRDSSTTATPWEFAQAADRAEIDPKSNMIFGDEASAVKAAVHGGGFVQLLQYEAEEALACGLLTEVLSQWSVRRVLSAITDRRLTRRESVQIFLRFLRTLLPESLPLPYACALRNEPGDRMLVPASPVPRPTGS